jgi:hypothetical protein
MQSSGFAHTIPVTTGATTYCSIKENDRHHNVDEATQGRLLVYEFGVAIV